MSRKHAQDAAQIESIITSAKIFVMPMRMLRIDLIT